MVSTCVAATAVGASLAATQQCTTIDHNSQRPHRKVKFARIAPNDITKVAVNDPMRIYPRRSSSADSIKARMVFPDGSNLFRSNKPTSIENAATRGEMLQKEVYPSGVPPVVMLGVYLKFEHLDVAWKSCLKLQEKSQHALPAKQDEYWQRG